MASRADEMKRYIAQQARSRKRQARARQQGASDDYWENIGTTAKDVGKELATEAAIGAATGGLGLLGRAAFKGGRKMHQTYKVGKAAERAAAAAKLAKKAKPKKAKPKKGKGAHQESPAQKAALDKDARLRRMRAADRTSDLRTKFTGRPLNRKHKLSPTGKRPKKALQGPLEVKPGREARTPGFGQTRPGFSPKEVARIPGQTSWATVMTPARAKKILRGSGSPAIKARAEAFLKAHKARVASAKAQGIRPRPKKAAKKKRAKGY